MQIVKDDIKLDYYVSKYNINEVFSIDMRPYMELVLFNKNEHICKASEKIEYMFFFVDGKAKVYTLLNNGKSLLLYFYKPFKVIGDVELIHHETAESNLQVIEDTICVAIPFKEIRKLALDDSKFLRFMCNSLSEKLISSAKYSSINLLYPLKNRLASYILGVSCDNKNENSNNIIFDGNLTEISELLGTSYRHLIRTLNSLCNEGAIKKNTCNYEIINANILTKLAGELYEKS